MTGVFYIYIEQKWVLRFYYSSVLSSNVCFSGQYSTAFTVVFGAKKNIAILVSLSHIEVEPLRRQYETVS